MSRREEPTRRQAVVLSATAAASLALGRASSAVAGAPSATVALLGKKRRFGMAIDLDRCLRCQACVVACAVENNVLPMGRQGSRRTRPIHWMDMLIPRAGVAADLGAGPAPIPCMHCEDPACAKVCPVGATYRADDGVVAQIWDRCIGCRACMVACPYSRRSYNWAVPEWPGGDPSSANPDVAVRLAGVVEKCTFCQHKLREVQERARLDEEVVTDEVLRHLPACAATCPTEAITFGDLADPDSALSQLVSSPRAFRLLGHLGTGPKVFYLREKR